MAQDEVARSVQPAFEIDRGNQRFQRVGAQIDALAAVEAAHLAAGSDQLGQPDLLGNPGQRLGIDHGVSLQRQLALAGLGKFL